MSTATLSLPRPHPAQRTVISSACRFNVVACGRRFGKSTLGLDRLLEPALYGWPVAWCGPSYPSLLATWELLRTMLAPIGTRRNEQEHRVELETDGVIEMWSLEEPDTIRGRAYARIVVDEAASARHLQYAWEQVLRPTLTDVQGDTWFLSTPKSLNYFHRLYQRGQDLAQPEWASWTFPTSANPYIPPAEIAAAKRELPERVFAQEYEAQFLESEGAVFRHVLEAIRPALPLPVPRPGQPMPKPQYVIGIDWARLQDFTVYCVVEAHTKACVAVDRFREIDYAIQLARLRALCGRFPPSRIIAERNAMGDPLVEQLQRQGMPVWPYNTTAQSKREAVEALQLAFEQGQITIPDDPILVGELMGYAAERLPSGMLRYGAPSGGHDDCVMALALAWQGVAQASPELAAHLQHVYNW